MATPTCYSSGVCSALGNNYKINVLNHDVDCKNFCITHFVQTIYYACLQAPSEIIVDKIKFNKVNIHVNISGRLSK